MLVKTVPDVVSEVLVTPDGRKLLIIFMIIELHAAYIRHQAEYCELQAACFIMFPALFIPCYMRSHIAIIGLTKSRPTLNHRHQRHAPSLPFVTQ